MLRVILANLEVGGLGVSIEIWLRWPGFWNQNSKIKGAGSLNKYYSFDFGR
jgi:hypothetical protein